MKPRIKRLAHNVRPILTNATPTPQAKTTIQDNIRVTEGISRDPEKNPSDGNLGIPDGGCRAWIIVLAGFLNFCTGFGILNSWGTFQHYYESQTGWTPAQITWIGNVQTGILFTSGLIIGPVYDKWGARPVMIFGSIIYFTSFFAAAYSIALWHTLLSQGVMFSIRNAFMFYATTGAIAEWFDKKRGVALGIAASGSSVGGILWPFLLNAIMIERSSVLWAHFSMALISLPFLLISCVVIKGRKGLAGHDAHGKLVDPSHRNARRAIFRWDFIAFTVSEFFLYLGFLIPFGLIPTYARSNGLVNVQANALLSICYGGSIFGRILAGTLGDRFGRFNILSLISILTGMMVMLWIKMTSFPALVAFSMLFGLFSGGIMPLSSTCVAQITPDMGYLGLRIGVMMAILSVTTFISTPISSSLRDVYADARDNTKFTALVLFSGATTITGGLLVLLTRLIWGSKKIYSF